MNVITTLGTWTPTCQPSKYDIEREDTSASSAGRTDDGTMHKEMTGSVLAISLGWEKVSKSVVESILSGTNAQYFNVTYYDPFTAGSKTQVFYRGNVSVTPYSAGLDIWDVSFKIVGQYANQY